MLSLQDFIEHAFRSGCNKFALSTHITPDGVVKVFIENDDHEIEADGVVKNNDVTLFENEC